MDASALLALLRAEPGAERVEPRLEGAGGGAVNLSEVVAKLIADDVPEGEIRRAIRRLELHVHPLDAEHAYMAGISAPSHPRFRALVRRSGLIENTTVVPAAN